MRIKLHLLVSMKIKETVYAIRRPVPDAD